MEKRELSLHNYWDSSTSEDRTEMVARAFKMIEKQKEYINLLNEEINGLIGMASVHGWKSNLVEQGIKLRQEMDEIQGPKTVIEKCNCPDDMCLLGDHPTCRWQGFDWKTNRFPYKSGEEKI